MKNRPSAPAVEGKQIFVMAMRAAHAGESFLQIAALEGIAYHMPLPAGKMKNKPAALAGGMIDMKGAAELFFDQ